jgi:hypothetical protein
MSRCPMRTETDRRGALMTRRQTAAQWRINAPISIGQISDTREDPVAGSNRLECCRRPAFATALTRPS